MRALIKLFALLGMIVASCAQAAIFSSTPYNLTNGTTADATQVMANFNQIIANGNANAAENGANSSITSLTGLLAPPAGKGSLLYFGTTMGGSANAQTISATNPGAFSLQVGVCVWWPPSLTNTGAATLNVNSTGAIALKKPSATGLLALTGGEITAGSGLAEACYDGTQYILESEAAVTSGGGGGSQILNLVIKSLGANPNTGTSISAERAFIQGAACSGALSLSNNASTVGVNGLDAGSLAASTWYYIYIISNGATCNSLVSASASAPTLPGGYTSFVRIGARPTDASAIFLATYQAGARADYWTAFGAANTTTFCGVASGSTAGFTAVTVTGAGACAPPVATRMIGQIKIGSGANAFAQVAQDSGGGGLLLSLQQDSVNTGGELHAADDIVLVGSVLYYNSNAAGGAFVLQGWYDPVPAH